MKKSASLHAMLSFSSDRNVDILENLLRDKINYMTGYSDNSQTKMKKLEQVFQYFDTHKTGQITLQQFEKAMVQMNFVGMSREIEGLFNRFDDDHGGSLSYIEFAQHMYGDNNERTEKLDVISRFKKLMVDLGANNGVHSLRRVFKKIDVNGSNTINRQELKDGMKEFGLIVSDKEITRLFRYLDRNDSDAINIDEFMAGIRAGMSYERKSMVRTIWDRIDKNNAGGLKFDVLRSYHDFKHHPEVVGGTITESEAEEIFCEHFAGGRVEFGNVTWHEFLDYYKGVSAIVEDDFDFELLLRNSWSMPMSPRSMTASTTFRRVLVTHNNGEQRIVQIVDDLTSAKFDHESIREILIDMGIVDIKSVDLKR